MTRRLCIVSRDSSALLGYLMVALRREPPGSDDLEFVVDRRHAKTRPVSGTDRRQGQGTDQVLTSHGYAIVEAAEMVESEEREAPAARGRSPRAWPAPDRVEAPSSARPREPEPEYVELEPLESADGASENPSRRALTLGTVALCALGAVGLAGSLAWQMMGGFGASPRMVSPPAEPDVAVTRRALDPAPVPAPAPPVPVEPPRASEPPAPPLAEMPASAPPPPAPTVAPPTTPPPRSSPAPAATPSRSPVQKRATVEPPARVAAVTRPSASVAPSATPGRSPAFAGLPRVELASEPDGTGAARTVTYTAQLRDPDNRPLVGADVSVHGTMREGGLLVARLEPTGTPGMYQGRAAVGRQTPTDIRVRVMMGGTRFEVPIDR